MRAHVVAGDGRIIDVTVTDLSASGCIVATPEELGADERVQLSILGSAPRQAIVEWSRGGKAELRFEGDSAAARQPRRARRLALAAEVSLRRASQPAYRVKVFNASNLGCSCEHIDRPSVGERLWVMFDGMEAIEAEVCWIALPKVGLSFARPIHPAVFDLLLQRLGGGDQPLPGKS